MRKNRLPIAANKLATRKDVQEAVRQLCAPLQPLFSQGRALVHVDDTGTTYPARAALMESFARPLWGLVPLAAGGGDSDMWPLYAEGISNGTNPQHAEYWGDLGEKDQLAVEMGPLAAGLLLAPDKIWHPLDEQAKKNLAAWISQINHRKVADSNWKFFVVLVNIALKKLGLEHDSDNLERRLSELDSFYLGDGWYSDGNRPQMDYYNPFAMHFYGLIYARTMAGEDPERAATYRQRAAAFAEQYIHWHAADGSTIPFGRSLIYRFGAAAFWSALAFAEVETSLSWGVIKGMALRNLRWWFSRPIFTNDGLLNLGYAYANLCMTESYNGPGSPYWAMKAFLCLAAGEDHPFWAAAEEPLPRLPATTTQPHPRMVIQRSSDQNHVVALQAGQWQAFTPSHTAAKSAKFAYSSAFAFSVPRENVGLSQGAYDSMLALHEGDKHFRVRRECQEFTVKENLLQSLWKPWPDVEISTWLLPAGGSWHVRVHRIETGRDLSASEGGFAIGCYHDAPYPVKNWRKTSEDKALASFPWGFSGIVNLHGKREPTVLTVKPNTNLVAPATVLPTLTGSLPAGSHLLACAVAAHPVAEGFDAIWPQPPICRAEEGCLIIEHDNKEIFRLETANR